MPKNTPELEAFLKAYPTYPSTKSMDALRKTEYSRLDVEWDVCFTRPNREDHLSIDEFRKCIDGKSSGAVRISVGMVTNINDVRAFLSFARGLLS